MTFLAPPLFICSAYQVQYIKYSTINTQNQDTHASHGGGLEDILIGMMDQDHDGSVIDDIGGMIMKQIFA